MGSILPGVPQLISPRGYYRFHIADHGFNTLTPVKVIGNFKNFVPDISDYWSTNSRRNIIHTNGLPLHWGVYPSFRYEELAHEKLGLTLINAELLKNDVLSIPDNTFRYQTSGNPMWFPWVNINSGNGLLLGCAQPLPEHMLINHRWGLVAFAWGQCHRKIYSYILAMSWKLLVQDNRHLISHWINKDSIFLPDPLVFAMSVPLDCPSPTPLNAVNRNRYLVPQRRSRRAWDRLWAERISLLHSPWSRL